MCHTQATLSPALCYSKVMPLLGAQKALYCWNKQGCHLNGSICCSEMTSNVSSLAWRTASIISNIQWNVDLSDQRTPIDLTETGFKVFLLMLVFVAVLPRQLKVMIQGCGLGPGRIFSDWVSSLCHWAARACEACTLHFKCSYASNSENICYGCLWTRTHFSVFCWPRWTEAKAAALLHIQHCKGIWPAGTKQANCSIVDYKSKQQSLSTPNIWGCQELLDCF